MPDENGDQTVSGGVITGGSFYGKVDNRDRSDFRPMYLGILAGGKSSPTTFAAGIGVCAVTAFTSLTGLALLRRKRRDEE